MRQVQIQYTFLYFKIYVLTQIHLQCTTVIKNTDLPLFKYFVY